MTKGGRFAFARNQFNAANTRGRRTIQIVVVRMERAAVMAELVRADRDVPVDEVGLRRLAECAEMWRMSGGSW